MVCHVRESNLDTNLAWLDDSADDYLDDKRRYSTLRESYRKWLQYCEKNGGADSQGKLRSFIESMMKDRGVCPTSKMVENKAKDIVTAYKENSFLSSKDDLFS